MWSLARSSLGLVSCWTVDFRGCRLDLQLKAPKKILKKRKVITLRLISIWGSSIQALLTSTVLFRVLDTWPSCFSSTKSLVQFLPRFLQIQTSYMMIWTTSRYPPFFLSLLKAAVSLSQNKSAEPRVASPPSRALVFQTNTRRRETPALAI